MGEDGSFSDALLVQPPYAPNHWGLVNFGWDIMGGWGWHDNGDGTFTQTTPPANEEFLPMSFYVMGLISPQEIPAIPLLESDQSPGWLSETIQAHQRWVPIERVVCAEGERLPTVRQSQRHFPAAFVVLTMDDALAGLGAVESARSQVPDVFARAMGDRATMDTTLLATWRAFLPFVSRQGG